MAKFEKVRCSSCGKVWFVQTGIPVNGCTFCEELEDGTRVHVVGSHGGNWSVVRDRNGELYDVPTNSLRQVRV